MGDIIETRFGIPMADNETSRKAKEMIIGRAVRFIDLIEDASRFREFIEFVYDEAQKPLIEENKELKEEVERLTKRLLPPGEARYTEITRQEQRIAQLEKENEELKLQQADVCEILRENLPSSFRVPIKRKMSFWYDKDEYNALRGKDGK